jgi:hypothetical protein
MEYKNILKRIKGRDLIDYLNKAEEIIDNYDVLYGCYFEYDSQNIKITDSDLEYSLDFSIEKGHYVPGHEIKIYSDGVIKIFFEEPFDGCGADKEVIEVVKYYLDKLEKDLRDDKINSVILKEEEYNNKLRLDIISKIDDLKSKISSNEELPNSEQDSKFLIDVDDKLEQILNSWYY